MQSFSLPNGRFSPSGGDALEDERKRLEEALRESEERFRGLFEASPWGLLIHDDGRILGANSTLAMMFGYDVSELVGMDAPHLVTPEWRDFTLQKRLAGCEEPYEAVCLRRDGTIFPVQLCDSAVHSNGRVVRMVAVQDLTERKQAEEALRESERKFRHVLDSSLDMVYCLNLKTFTYDYVSPSCKEVLGYTPEEFAAVGFMGAGALVHPDDVQRVLANFAHVRNHPNVEYRFRHKELGYRWMSDSRSVVFDDRGGSAVIGALRDITEGKLEEEALRGSEERFRLIAQAASDGIWDWDLVTGAVWWNEGMRKLIGHSPNELGYAPSDVGARLARWYGHVDAADRNRVVGSIWAVIQTGGESWSQEYRVRWADGSCAHALGRGYVIRDMDGKPVRMIGGITDITERRLAEEKLAYQAQLLASVNDAIMSTDEQFIVRSWNPAAERIYGWRADEVLGRLVWDVFRSEFLGWPVEEELRRQLVGVERAQALRTLFESGRFHGELVQYRKDGTRVHIEARGIALRDSRGQNTGYVSVNRDITERKRAEEALQNLATFPGENPNPIVRVARNGTVIFANESSGPLLELWGSAAGAALPPEPHQQVESALTAGRLVTGETVCGDRTFLVICAPVAGRDYVNIYGVDITERKRAEDALRESEERFRLIARTTSDVIWDSDLTTGRVWRNEGTQRVFGYAPSEEGPRVTWWYERVHPEDRDRVAGGIYATISGGGRSWFNEYRFRRVDGSYAHVQERSYVIRDSDGRPVRMIGGMTDISERKRAEEALRTKDSAIASSISAIALADLDGNVTYVNPSLLRMWGFDDERDALGKPASAFWQTREKALEVAKALRDNGSWTGEMVAIRENGSTFNVEMLASMDTDEAGNPVCMMASVVDITRRKQAQRALEESEKRYRLLAENATDIIWIRDLDLRVVYVNPAVTRIRGYSVEEVMAQTLEEVLTPASLELARKVFVEEIAEDRVEERDLYWWRTLELEHTCKDGSTVWLEVKVTALREDDDQIAGILGISRDISERKRAEEALQKAREELEYRVERRMQKANAHGLTFRELTVLHLVAGGESDKEIAATLGISTLTASKHLANILRKMGAASRTEAGVRAIRQGLLD
jgi:PAS domain S-box-containing protein